MPLAPLTERKDLWNRATVQPEPAQRIGNSWDWEDIPAGFAIIHPTAGKLTGWATRKAAEAELTFCREHGRMSTFETGEE